MLMPDDSDHLQRSRYNFFLEREEGVIGYNARTGTFALLAHDVAEIVRTEMPLSNIQDIDTLMLMGFVHQGDELAQIVDRFYRDKNQDGELYLTIAPTLGCNFSCDYCYQDDVRSGKIMSVATQEASIRFIASRIAEGRTNVSCTWYGGEPLLAKDIVLNMSSQLRTLVDASGGRLTPMTIITNGVLLDVSTAESLAQVGIKTAQISIDSYLYAKPKLRGVVDGYGNPSPILKNIIEARDKVDIKIRINVSLENSKDIPEIIAVLNKFGLNRSYYLARIYDFESEFSSNQANIAPLGTTKLPSLTVLNGGTQPLGRSDFALFEKDTLLKRPEALPAILNRLKPKSHACSATTGHMFVIDPGGYISRCWASVGEPSQAMGNVNDSPEGLENSDVAKRWTDYAAFKYVACASCQVLPLCMGGCSFPRVFKDAGEKSACEAIREQIQFCIEEIGSRIEISSEQRQLIS